MKAKFTTNLIVIALALVLALPATCTFSFAQQRQTTPPPPQSPPAAGTQPQRERRVLLTTDEAIPNDTTVAPQQSPQVAPTPPAGTATAGTRPTASTSRSGNERLEPDDRNTMRPDVPTDTQANRTELMGEDGSAVLPYYNNFLSNYRIGPEDVISITVFNQERYSRPSITVPPNGRISHQLIPGGVFVVGKTTTQLEDEMKTRLDEFIIDPIVTISLDRAASARYFVMGHVATPGVRVMARRLNIMEALAESGGVAQSGNKRNVLIMRLQPDGNYQRIPVNVRDIERGRLAATNYHLVPGDYIIVPGNTWNTIERYTRILSLVSFARIFTGGF